MMAEKTRNKFDTTALHEIMEKTTKVFRKGERDTVRKEGVMEIHEIFGYPSIKEAPMAENFVMVDMVFVDVVVDKKIAFVLRNSLTDILDNYPDKGMLAQGPSYIAIAGGIEMEQEWALRLMALGSVLGLWEIITARTLLPEADDAQVTDLAGRGYLMISGYRKSAKLARKE